MSNRPFQRAAMTVCAALTAIIIGGCSAMPSGPRELDFDLSEAFLRMDEAVAETIEGLPDFPGFETRTTLKLECAAEGYESYEMNYTLPEATIGDDLVTREYFEVLKDYWPTIDYEVHDEREYPDGTPKALEARREDGINVWYSNMLGQIVIHSQAICVRVKGSQCAGPPRRRHTRKRQHERLRAADPGGLNHRDHRRGRAL